jgi:hypothetical protein
MDACARCTPSFGSRVGDVASAGEMRCRERSVVRYARAERCRYRKRGGAAARVSSFPARAGVAAAWRSARLGHLTALGGALRARSSVAPETGCGSSQGELARVARHPQKSAKTAIFSDCWLSSNPAGSARARDSAAAHVSVVGCAGRGPSYSAVARYPGLRRGVRCSWTRRRSRAAARAARQALPRVGRQVEEPRPARTPVRAAVGASPPRIRPSIATASTMTATQRHRTCVPLIAKGRSRAESAT